MLILGLAKLSTAMAQERVQQEAGVRVTKDTAKDVGEEILDTFNHELQKAVPTHRGQHVNLKRHSFHAGDQKM